MSVFSDIYRILTLTCDESARLASAELDRRLTLAERIALRAHTMICRSCRAFLRQVRFIREAAQKAGGSEEGSLSDAAKARIKAALDVPHDDV